MKERRRTRLTLNKRLTREEVCHEEYDDCFADESRFDFLHNTLSIYRQTTSTL